MRESVSCWLRAVPLAALVAAAPLLLIAANARSVPASASPWPECGVAAWTGTCVCAIGPHGPAVSLAAFARTHHPTAAALDEAKRQCGLPS
jgi:cytochrome c oxidase assembly factor CtaG